ncbi:MAG TPA: translation elongation factor 4 [Thermodesulfovibrionia bacterium]|nr:translation elongation factor 4 [Thermodesulfovibrionia bacterium]
MANSKIRNFSIIAHIDHGKSTLADRFLEITEALSFREMEKQVLDTMDLEKERGITIKAHAVRLTYKSLDGNEYILNLIDTPGHVDFSYEVSRSLASCEGALLVVDATQGVEAQTMANTYVALEHDLAIIPVINKIDLPAAEPDKVKREIEESIGIDSSEVLLVSAKQGTGVKEILEAVIKRVPPPKGNIDLSLKAMIFDSWFDNYLGVIILVRVFDGKVQKGNRIRLMATHKDFEVDTTGVFTPKMKVVEQLQAGEVGYIVAGIKEVADTKIGDTVTDSENPTATPFPGYKEAKPMVFCGIYPVETSNYERLKDALAKLRLNDYSFTYEPETSLALGFGFRCGFLGLLHMEIIQERLEREFDLSLLSTAPTVVYRVTEADSSVVYIDSPSMLKPGYLMLEEPFIKAHFFLPQQYVGQVFELCQEKRGKQLDFSYIGQDRVMISYELPLNEILWDFYDRLKSITRGYASMDYEFLGYRESNLVRLDILLNGESVDALSIIVHKEAAYTRARLITEKLRQVIPRQMFEVSIQAAIAGRVIARESIKAMRKNVLAKCYGGDITRKRKLLEKQKEGKKKMKRLGRIEVPQEAFLSVLKVK